MSRPETAPLLSSDLRSSFTDSDSDFHPESRPILHHAQSVPASSRPFPSHSASTSPSYSGMGASRLNRSASAPSPHHHGGPAVQAPSRQVRINMLNGIRSSQYESLIFCLSVTFNLPQIIAVAIVLATHWNPNACDQPLHYWALIYAGRLSLLILTASFPLLCRTNMNHPVLRRWSETLNMIGFVWLSLGCYWLFSSHSCSTLATSVYQLCYALLLLNFLLFCAPCLCFCAMLPLVFFCLPALLRLSASLGPQRGATPIQIDAVPTERYNADSSSLDSEHTECAVCLVPYQEGEELRVLPCNSEERLRHRFHKECVDQWMRINGTCPVCRAPIVGEVAGASSGVGAGASGAGARGEPLNAAEVQV